MENKQAICKSLCDTLQKTRNLQDVMELNYDEVSETVTAVFSDGTEQLINVAMDSGTAMIQDILSQLL